MVRPLTWASDRQWWCEDVAAGATNDNLATRCHKSSSEASFYFSNGPPQVRGMVRPLRWASDRQLWCEFGNAVSQKFLRGQFLQHEFAPRGKGSQMLMLRFRFFQIPKVTFRWSRRRRTRAKAWATWWRFSSGRQFHQESILWIFICFMCFNCEINAIATK
jgi:hypothetical protein